MRVIVIGMIFFFFLSFTVAVTAEVEVGKEYGCNLNPLYADLESVYTVAGESESEIVALSFPNGDAIFTEISAYPESQIEMGEFEAVVQLPPTAKYEIQFGFRPLRPGLLRLDLHEAGKWTHDAKVWLKVLPQNAPLPYDVNWDGVLTLEDVSQIFKVLPRNGLKPEKRGVEYYRSDVNKDTVVNQKDLILVRKKLGLNPYDFNDDGHVDINDWAFVGSAGKREALVAQYDQNGDGVVEIGDFVVLHPTAKPAKAAPATQPKPIGSHLSVSWGAIKK